MRSFTLPILFAGSAAARIFNLETRADGCKDVHIFLAKGNNEPYPGRQGKLVNAICDGLPSCDYEDILFNNPGGSDYCVATNEGMVNGKAQVIAYNEKCPDSKLVLSGFSQGGDVVSSILAGGGGDIFGCTYPATTPLGASSKAGKQIAAAMTFGDVRHTANQPWNVLDGASGQGVVPRTPDMLAELARYGATFRDYCNAGDGVCGDGNIVDEHLNYFDKYSNIAAEFVHERLRAFSGPASTSTSASSAVSTSKTPSATKSVASSTFSHPNNATVTTGHNSGTTSAPDVSVTVPHHGNNPGVTSRPAPITTVITQTLTVTEDCESKGSTFFETVTLTAKCPICTKIPEYATVTDLYEGPTTTGTQGAFVSNGNHFPVQTGTAQPGNGPKWTTFTTAGHVTTAYIPGGSAQPSSGLGGKPGNSDSNGNGPESPTKPSSASGNSPAAPSAPVSGAAAMVPHFTAIVALLAMMVF
ncbi:unnamed protein product [Clonostachys chloroleuca]|uniref:Cutinase n=1 Tax=Clonostachys chloroleuca TaxID=1926264 RepID=A0AA35QEY9_9HYPO|nr:unnamed protein product [Clonostachys chloroleuca]